MLNNGHYSFTMPSWTQQHASKSWETERGAFCCFYDGRMFLSKIMACVRRGSIRVSIWLHGRTKDSDFNSKKRPGGLIPSVFEGSRSTVPAGSSTDHFYLFWGE